MTPYNTRSPAVKRLMREAKELSQPTELYYAQPLEDNLFEWHFTIRGPEGSEFEGGIYHGQISLPTEYPMKPPNIMLLTPNGRFEQYRQICLSISGYHPETWCPSWSIRTALLAIIGFMPSSGAGAIGSMSVPIDERRKLAVSSRNFTCDICGPTKDLLLPLTSASSSTAKEAQEVASQFILIDANTSKDKSSESQTSQLQSENKNTTPDNLVTNGFHQSALPQLSALNGMPRPAYWLCYPIYLSNESTSVQAQETAAGDMKKDPPLSFEDWLKTVHECSSAPRNTGRESPLGSSRKSTSDKPPNQPTDQVRVDTVPAPECSPKTEQPETPVGVVEPEPAAVSEGCAPVEMTEEPAVRRPASSSSPTTIVLDDVDKDPVSGERSASSKSNDALCDNPSDTDPSSPGPERSGPTALLRRESSVEAERVTLMSSEPAPQQAHASVAQEPKVVPLPCKEVAQRILKNAAERHRQRVCAMQARMEGAFPGGQHGAMTLLPQRTQGCKWVALAIAIALIALLLRRFMIMVVTGSC